jgi:uncharacterized protein (TIGR03118 family)
MLAHGLVRGRTVRATIGILGAAALALQGVAAEAGVLRGAYVQTNLVSDLPGLAQHQDPDLKNPWGLSSGPVTPIWVSDNNAGVATIYRGDGTKFILNNGTQQVPAVQIPAPGNVPGGTPTGTVFNGTTDFQVSQNGRTAASRFVFATEDGTIVGWSPSVDFSSGVIAVDNSTAVDAAGDVGAVYKGLASGSSGGQNFLYATNFRFARVDVFDKDFSQVTLGGSFSDPAIPAGFAPFGIQNLGGLLFVTYARQDADKHDDVKGPGNGFVDVFRTDGTLVRRFASGGTLNSPWGVALSPASFGNFHDDVLVGDFGDGRINAFGQDGAFRGQLKSQTSAPVQIDGLWGLRFGNGGAGGDPGTLFFSAGINDEADGLFGTLAPAE